MRGLAAALRICLHAAAGSDGPSYVRIVELDWTKSGLGLEGPFMSGSFTNGSNCGRN